MLFQGVFGTVAGLYFAPAIKLVAEGDPSRDTGGSFVATPGFASLNDSRAVSFVSLVNDAFTQGVFFADPQGAISKAVLSGEGTPVGGVFGFSLGPTSLNNLGHITFLPDVRTPGQPLAIFKTVPRPPAEFAIEKVAATGDTALNGSFVFQGLGGHDINDRSDVAFAAEGAGRPGIFLAAGSTVAQAGSHQTQPSCLRRGQSVRAFGSGWETGDADARYDFLLDGARVAQQGPDLALFESPDRSFVVPAATEPGRRTLTVELVRTQDQAVLRTTSIQVFVVGGPDPGSVERIGGFPPCGPGSPRTLSPRWGRFGTTATGALESDAGEKLELECVGAAVPSYELFYTPPGGARVRVGKCPFEGGCNVAFFTHAGDTNPVNGKPDCLLRTHWTSKDYEKNDVPNPWTREGQEDPPALDWAVSFFNAETQTLRKVAHKFEYAVTPPVSQRVYCFEEAAGNPEGAPLQSRVVDPPVGPETEAFFDEVTQRLDSLPPPHAPMVEDLRSPFDLNGDAVVDAADGRVLLAALGGCAGQPRYDPRADLDADGCVTPADAALFPVLPSDRPVPIDIKPGSEPNVVNLKSEGVIPVAVLTTDDLDATTIDPLSVTFGPGGATESYRRGHPEDVDGDGRLDLLLHFRTQETGLAPGATEACLTGHTYAGVAIQGCDAVQAR